MKTEPRRNRIMFDLNTDHFRTLGVELNNIAADFFDHGEYALARSTLQDAYQAMTLVIHGLSQKKIATAADNFFSTIVQGREKLNSMSKANGQIIHNLCQSKPQDSPLPDSTPRLLVKVLKMSCVVESSPTTRGTIEYRKQSHSDSAVILYNLSLVSFAAGKTAFAEKCLKKALVIGASERFSKDTFVFMALLNNVAFTEHNNGKNNAAIKNLQVAFKMGKSLRGKLVSNQASQEDMDLFYHCFGTILYNLGMIELLNGKSKRALDFLDCSLSALLKAQEVGNNAQYLSDAASMSYNIGMVFLDKTNVTNAMKAFQFALHIKRYLVGDDHIDVAKVLYYMGRILVIKGELTDALTIYKDTLKIETKCLGNYHPEVAATLCNIAQIYHSQGQTNEAIEVYKDALSIMLATLGERSLSAAFILQTLGSLYLGCGQTTEAFDAFQMATAIVEHAHPSSLCDIPNIPSEIFISGLAAAAA